MTVKHERKHIAIKYEIVSSIQIRFRQTYYHYYQRERACKQQLRACLLINNRVPFVRYPSIFALNKQILRGKLSILKSPGLLGDTRSQAYKNFALLTSKNQLKTNPNKTSNMKLEFNLSNKNGPNKHTAYTNRICQQVSCSSGAAKAKPAATPCKSLGAICKCV